jgi:hypothetical protein
MFILLLMMIPIGSVQAQEALTLESLNVALWPEYDRPSMLVIYKVILSPDVPLPAEVGLRIPAAAGVPNAVAELGVDGSLYDVAYEREVRGDWGVVKFIATVPEVQLEYYDPGLSKEGANRHFEYVWPGDYPVSTLSVQVQQPVGVQEIRISPVLGGSSQGPDGLTYFGANVGSYGAGEKFELTIDYEKDTDALSVELAELLQVQPITQDTSGRTSLLDVMPWFVGILGLGLIVVGVWWFWQGERKVTRQRADKRRRRRVAAPEASQVKEGEVVYCHQCGKRAEPGDRFCRVCGTELKIDT